MKSRVLFISHSSELGGAEHCLYSLLSELNRQDYEPLVLLPGSGPLEEKISALGILTRIVELEWGLTTDPDDSNRRVRFFSGLRRRSEAIVDIIKRERIDVVFTNSLTMLDGAVAAYSCGVPHVWQVLELLDADPDLHPLIDLTAFYHLVHLLSDKIVTVSRSVQSNIEVYCPSNKITTVYSGIDLPAESGAGNLRHELNISPDDFLISFVGRLSRRKGILDLVDAAPAIVSAVPNSRFVIAGADGGVEQAALRAVSEKRLTPYFRFLGLREDSLQIIASSDVFVLPSVADPLPIVILEAMFLGTPIVATTSGGASEMVLDNQTGFLVPVGDPAAIALAVIRTAENPERARAMGQQGKERALHLFALKRYAGDIEKIFDQVKESTNRDPLAVAIMGSILELLEDAAADKATLSEQERRLRDYEELQRKLTRNPLFKAYHWLKYLGRNPGSNGQRAEHI